MKDNVMAAGVFNTPVGATDPAPAFPSDSYSFSITAMVGYNLSFATMFVQSNDLFIGPDGAGIALFDENDSPISGDITMYVNLWDAGTEVNQEPGIGGHQAPRQADKNTGTDEMGSVMKISDIDDGYTYPAASDVLKITITAE